MNQVLITIGVILNATLMYTPPLLFAALGSCFSEKSGVVNPTKAVKKPITKK